MNHIFCVSRSCCTNLVLAPSLALVVCSWQVYSWNSISCPFMTCLSFKRWQCLDLVSTMKNKKLELPFEFLISSVDPWVAALEECTFDISLTFTVEQSCWWGITVDFFSWSKVTTANNYLQGQGIWNIMGMVFIHALFMCWAIHFSILRKVTSLQGLQPDCVDLSSLFGVFKIVCVSQLK